MCITDITKINGESRIFNIVVEYVFPINQSLNKLLQNRGQLVYKSFSSKEQDIQDCIRKVTGRQFSSYELPLVMMLAKVPLNHRNLQISFLAQMAPVQHCTLSFAPNYNNIQVTGNVLYSCSWICGQHSTCSQI